jgi:8-oxo-dGTP diphosphatase
MSLSVKVVEMPLPTTCSQHSLRLPMPYSQEEAGVECQEILLRGTISWPGFGKNGEDWFGFIFRIDRFQGTPFNENPEGTLSWVPVERILDLPLWEGDRYFLPLVFGDDPRQFHGVMPYDGGRPVSWTYSLI